MTFSVAGNVYADCFGASQSPISYTVPTNATTVFYLKADIESGASFLTMRASLSGDTNNLQGASSSAVLSSPAVDGNVLTLGGGGSVAVASGGGGGGGGGTGYYTPIPPASTSTNGGGVVLGASTTNPVALAQLLQNLEQQLITLEFKANSCSFVFDKNLSKGMAGSDVKNLQTVLNYTPLTQVAQTGAGSLNDESTYFGNATKNAVIVFQNTFANQILTPIGLTSGNGYVGSATRAVLNNLCGK